MYLGYIRQRLSWKNLKIAGTVIFVLGLFYILYIWHLGSLLPGISPAESAARMASSSFHGIINSPINISQRIIQYTAYHLILKVFL